MGESVNSGATLEASVSFGRFENDALSWEKWSSFSPNKYLEEVEKCSTPGSVAQKKAYFEAHYKRIAAQKAEQLEQEKLMESARPFLDGSTSENHIEDSTGNAPDFGVCNGGRSTEVERGEGVGIVVNSTTFDESKEDGVSADVRIVLNSTTFGDRKEDGVSGDDGTLVNGTTCSDCMEDGVSGDVGVVNSTSFGNSKEGGVIVDVGVVLNSPSFDGSKEDNGCVGDGQSSLVEDKKEELDGSQSANTIESIEREKVMLLEEEHTSQNSSPYVKQAPKVVNEAKRAPESEKKNVTVKTRNITQKKTPSNKDQTPAGTKKKLVSPATKSFSISAPRLSRATPTSASVSASQSSTKKLNGTHLPRNRNALMEDNRTAPKSLHMSLSLGPPNSCASNAPTRKSLIMEQMADKDIIKRAFKAFQNNYGHLRSSDDEKVNLVSSEVPEQKVTPLTRCKENEGLRRAADKRAVQRGQLQTKLSPATSRLSPSIAKKNVKTVAPSVGPNIDERAEKRREFLKNLEQKSIARGAEKAKLGAKSKQDKDGNMQKVKQNSYLIATPAKNYAKGGLSKSLQMGAIRNKVNLPNR